MEVSESGVDPTTDEDTRELESDVLRARVCGALDCNSNRLVFANLLGRLRFGEPLGALNFSGFEENKGVRRILSNGSLSSPIGFCKSLINLAFSVSLGSNETFFRRLF